MCNSGSTLGITSLSKLHLHLAWNILGQRLLGVSFPALWPFASLWWHSGLGLSRAPSRPAGSYSLGPKVGQNHPRGLLKCRLPGFTPRFWFTLGCGVSIGNSNKFQGDDHTSGWGPSCENLSSRLTSWQNGAALCDYSKSTKAETKAW